MTIKNKPESRRDGISVLEFYPVLLQEQHKFRREVPFLMLFAARFLDPVDGLGAVLPSLTLRTDSRYSAVLVPAQGRR